MFAPDHAKAASELARVCKPGGRIALASWTPDGYVGQMFKLFSSFVPSTVPLSPPPLWGIEPHLKTIFGPAIKSIKSNVRQTIMRFRSPEEKIDVFRAYFGPTVKAFAALDRGKQQELNTQWIDLIRRFDRNKGVGPVAVSADYLESVIERA
jgi:SAM-dependent methyltransferase